MDNPRALARILVPKIPLIGRTLVSHTLGLTEESWKWDLKTELAIKIIRAVIAGSNSSISKAQGMSKRDPGVKGNMWISTAKFPVDEKSAEEGGVADVVMRVCREMDQGGEVYGDARMESLEAEWTGYRADARSDEPLPEGLSETEKYERMMKEVTSDVVILYFHGGAHYLMDPASHRGLCARLCKKTGGRALSVRYRLAPQNPFPSQLVDALHAYLALIDPPPGSPHAPVPAENIIFAGDSAGGHISATLLQLILQLRRNPSNDPTKGAKVRWNNKTIEAPLPAGVTLMSPWLDITRSMPSSYTNTKYDYLPAPSPERTADAKAKPWFLQPPACPLWPASPPRTDLLCDGSALCHPLVSPLAALDWQNAPPFFIACGEEMLADEDRIFARRLVSQGVKVVWEQYEAMPHVFCMVLEKFQVAELCYSSWASAIRDFVSNKKTLESRGTWYSAPKLERKSVEVGGEVVMSDEECVALMKETRDKRIEAFGQLEEVVSTMPVEPRL